MDDTLFNETSGLAAKKPSFILDLPMRLGIAKDARTASLMIAFLGVALILAGGAIWYFGQPPGTKTTHQILDDAKRPQALP